jgi:hypothetical protein
LDGILWFLWIIFSRCVAINSLYNFRFTSNNRAVVLIKNLI